jgi:hypothetical protein
VPRAELACGRVGDDGDVMAAQPVRPALRLLSGAGHLHGHQLLYLHGVKNHSSTRVGGGARSVRLGPCASRGQTCRARRRLVVQGGDLSCEAETLSWGSL